MNDTLEQLRPPGGWYRREPGTGLATECPGCHRGVRLRLVHIETGTVDCPPPDLDQGEA